MKLTSGKMNDENRESTFREKVLVLLQTSGQLVEGNDYEQLRIIFQDILSEMTNSENNGIDLSFVSCLEGVLSSAELQLDDAGRSESDLAPVYQCVTSCFRVCRNLCALCASNQTTFHESERLLLCVRNLLSRHQARDSWTEDSTVLLRCAVQFLCNYSSGNVKNQQQVWTMFQDFFLYCLNSEDEKLQNYVQMGIHICLSNAESLLRQMTQTSTCWNILQKCVHLAVKEDSVNGLLVIEDALKLVGFCENVYNTLDNQLRLLILEVLINQLQQIQDSSFDSLNTDCKPGGVTCDIPCATNLEFLAADFVVQSHHIPRMDTLDHTMALVIVKELEALCLASVHHKLYPCLQEMQQLIKVSISILQSMEDLGKEGNSVFVNADKMSDLHNIDQEHPVYGLKRDLIRLLGNLAYKNKVNQDLIREQNGIPLILNKTNIDGKNPFIVQWSVFAIHNLTEDNPENQQYIADLKMEGVANNQGVLDEMGLAAEKKGEKVVIKKKTCE